MSTDVLAPARVSAAASVSAPASYASVEDLLAAARSGLARLTPAQARRAMEAGARFVDVRPAWQRRREGEIPGSIIVERNHLEWRLHPRSAARLGCAQAGQRWIVVCSEGYTSSLAAAALLSVGVPATDLIGGFQAWQAEGFDTTPSLTQVEGVVGAGTSLDFGELGGPHVEDKASH
jgi:rhodanese-related sulfurtransferase